MRYASVGSVKVDRKELLNILLENYVEHKNEYEESCAHYKIAVLTEARKVLAKAETGDPQQFIKSINIPEPYSNAKEYDRAIRMMELSVDESIELTAEQFDCLVMDNWSWKDNFNTTKSFLQSYGGAAR